MSNDNTRLYRVEIQHINGQVDCHQCLHADQLGELLAPIVAEGEAAAGMTIEIFDYQRWRPDAANKPLIRFQAV
ncbi:hypothetical protein [Rhizobium sp. 1399]|uniref:hypothetical protein n=1 Tax=Rhizobium sp. 1399 TaxID=2817758 RepID=UPI00285E7637|nr:hypothetical protein [Rhizobium sp. 1399]MDR6671203.1 hypothetical protein [Rhizobium sp. 1399]